MTSVRGLTDLFRKQNKVIALLRGEDIADALLKSMKPIQVRAKGLAPFDTHNLRTSIDTEVERANNSSVVGRTGTNVEYARRIELGFVGTDSLGRRYNQSGKPYLAPAARMEETNILKRMADESNKLIKKAAS